REVGAIADSFANVIRESGYTCYAAAIMPEHVHLVMRKHRDSAETITKHLQDASRAAVLELRTRPITHPVWGGPGWRVFLESRADLERTIRYVEENPTKARLPRQVWAFVRRYDGWVPSGATVSARNRKRRTGPCQ
ncbi:MAG: transposase, partial [Planctomycetaceae bacterium]|nr:transposase [Planctomycetaceae bacterium]